MPLKELAERRNLLHRKSDANTILKHALDDPQIGDTALVSSFGAESIVLLHMAAMVNRDVPVIFLDTEMLFHETLQYQRDVADFLELTDVRTVTPSRTNLLVHDVDGLLHQVDTDACCDLRKTQPLEAALQGFGGWITGRKRYHNGQRALLPVFEKEGRRIKVNPLANWSADQTRAYMAEHNLPRHPLVAKGYPSIGCWPCTSRVRNNEHARAGRWRDSEKSECGIHFPPSTTPSTRNARKSA